jgi:hypothetical protein
MADEVAHKMFNESAYGIRYEVAKEIVSTPTIPIRKLNSARCS